MNCKHENEGGNFCSICGATLREKCPECGEMERIDRAVCETKINQIERERRVFVQRKNSWIDLAAVGWLAGFAVCFLAGVFTKPEWIIGLTVLLFVVNLFFVFEVFKRSSRINRKSNAEFFRLHPDYAELLKRTER